MMDGLATVTKAAVSAHQAPKPAASVVETTLDGIAALDPVLKAFAAVTSTDLQNVNAIATNGHSEGAASHGRHAYSHRRAGDPERVGTKGTAEAVWIAPACDASGLLPVLASFCGLFGLKPTCSPLLHEESSPPSGANTRLSALTQDASGLLAANRIVQDLVRDPDSRFRRAGPVNGADTDGIDGLRIAVTGSYFTASAGQDALAALRRVVDAVHVMRTIDVPDAPIARSAAYIIAAVEAAATHRRQIAESPLVYEEAIYGWLAAGTLAPQRWYTQARRFRSRYRRRVLALFDEFDLIIAPATPCAAPALGQNAFRVGAQEVPLRGHLDVFSQPFSFIGLPVVTVPAADVVDPIGVQIIAAPWHEADALRIAAVLEKTGVAAASKPITTHLARA